MFRSLLRNFANNKASSLINVSRVCLLPTFILGISTVIQSNRLTDLLSLLSGYHLGILFYPSSRALPIGVRFSLSDGSPYLPSPSHSSPENIWRSVMKDTQLFQLWRICLTSSCPHVTQIASSHYEFCNATDKIWMFSMKNTASNNTKQNKNTRFSKKNT